MVNFDWPEAASDEGAVALGEAVAVPVTGEYYVRDGVVQPVDRERAFELQCLRVQDGGTKRRRIVLAPDPSLRSHDSGRSVSFG